MNDIQLKVYKHFENLPLVTFSQGSILIKPNEKPKNIYYIEKGIVEVRDLSAGSVGFTVNIFKPTAFFPMAWAINHTKNRYTYVALTGVTVRQTKPEEALEYINTNPDVMFDLLSRVVKGSDGLQSRLVLASNSTSTARLLYEILLDAYRFGESSSQKKSKIFIKQNTLALRSGLARETVSRELQKIEQQGFIVRKKQNIIVNVAAIEKFLNI